MINIWIWTYKEVKRVYEEVCEVVRFNASSLGVRYSALL